MGKSKEPIRLRQRKTASGNITLYLDIYLNGKRSYEYLKLYLIPETNRKDKEKNRQTLQLAEAIFPLIHLFACHGLKGFPLAA